MISKLSIALVVGVWFLVSALWEVNDEPSPLWFKLIHLAVYCVFLAWLFDVITIPI